MSMLPPIHAGTSGFRGRTGVEIVPEHAYALGVLYARHLEVKLGRLPNLSIGHDQRSGAQAIALAAASGALSAGCGVTWLGQVSTGEFCAVSFANEEERTDGGILITGSHMPPDRIGIILLNGDGSYCDTDITDRIEAMLAGRSLSEVIHGTISQTRVMTAIMAAQTGMSAERGSGLGRMTIVANDVTRRIHERALLEKLDRESIVALNLKILVDPGNGTAGASADSLFRALGCEVTGLHMEPKEIPDRPSECRAETCGKAIRQVTEQRLDMGVCFDGDGDRVLFIDAYSRPLGEDAVGAIFARHLLGKGHVCVTPINSSRLIEVVCGEIGADVRYCKVGQPATNTMVKQLDAAMCYETSAKYGFPGVGGFLWYDAVFAVCKMLEIMARTGKSLAELADELPSFHHAERGFAVPDENKERIIEQVAQDARQALDGQYEDTDETDGIRIELRGSAYVMFRASGTEPKVRLYVDAPDEARMTELVELCTGLIRAEIEDFSQQ